MTRVYPRRSQQYTIEQIYNELKLRDSPHLGAYITNPLGEKVSVCVQDAMSKDAEIMKAFAGKSFTYRCETHEWIPVFDFVGTEQEFLECVEVAVDIDPHQDPDEPVSMVVWPKGTEYIQYYRLSEDGGSIVHSYGTDPLPPKTKEAIEAFNKQKKQQPTE